MPNSRTNEWLALGAIIMLIWTLPVAAVYAICCAVALFLAVRWDGWYFGLIGTYAACMVAVHSMPGPYDAYASEERLIVLKAGITIITTTWLAIRSFPTKNFGGARKSVIPVPSGALRSARWLFLMSGVVANASRYSEGVPLFSGQVDVVRQIAREQSNIITGFLSEGWTLGVMITIAPLLVERRRPKPFEIVWLLIFLVGAFAGASRNTLLTAVVPGVLVGLHFRTSLASGPTNERHRRLGLRLNRFGLATAVGALVLGLMWFQSRRILSGVGLFERTFQQRFGGDGLKATVASLDLSLSGSFETLSRLIGAERGGSETEFTVLQGLGAVPRWMGYNPDLYQVTLALSAPYHMNTATYLAAPIVDFGIAGGIVASFALGLLFGGVDRWLVGDSTVAGQLLRYYVIYIAVFSVYEFGPFIQPSWIPVVTSLLMIRHYSLKGVAPGYSRDIAHRVDGHVIPPGLLSRNSATGGPRS